MLDRSKSFSESRLRVTRSYATTLAVLFIGILLTYVSWENALRAVQDEDQDRFNLETSESLELIQERMDTYGQVLRGLKGLFVASDNVSREEFRTYTDELALQQNYPGVLGVAFALDIEPSELDLHLERVQGAGFPFYTVYPTGDRDRYSSIVYIEPFSGNNLNAFGFDMYSEPVRRAAMDRAQSTGSLTLSGKVSLVQDADRGPVAGVLLYLPVYEYEVSPSAANSDALLGWVYAPFSMDILMDGIHLTESPVSFSIHDGVETGAESRLYSTFASETEASDWAFSRVEQIHFAQRIWTVSFFADSSFIEAHENPEPGVVATIGGLFTLMLASLVWSLSSSKERAEARAAAMTRELSETEFRWKSALSGAGHGVWDWNIRTNEVTYNAEWKSMLGYEDHEIKNDISEWVRLLHPDDAERARAAVRDFLAGKTPNLNLQQRLRTRDGHWRWILSRGAIIHRDKEGNPVRTVGTHTDIDHQKKLELALSESDQRFRGAFESVAVGMALVGLQGEWLKVNESLLKMLQYSEDELLKMTFQDITHPDDLDRDLDLLHALVAGDIPSYRMEKRYFRKDGSVIWAVLSVSMVLDEHGDALHFVSQVENITERKKLEELVAYQATHDELTGLPNRRLFQERLEQATSLGERHNHMFAVMFIDVDHFKQVNDHLGHDVGDGVLKWIALQLSNCIRSSDILARQGGDEFVVLLPEISSEKTAEHVVRKFFSAIQSPCLIKEHVIDVTLSIGIAIFDPQTPDSTTALMRKADMALYEVKRAGRNGFRIYREGDEESA